MEARVAAALLARHRAGEPPAPARELLALLALPRAEKSRLNQLLYKTAAAPPHDNPLGLPREFRLVRTETAPPAWAALPRATDPALAPAERLAWRAYAAIAASPGTPVPLDALLRDAPGAPDLAGLAALVRAHTLTGAEHVEPAPPATLVLRVPAPPATERVFLDCDSIAGPARDHVQCVVLGMAILECVAAHPGRAVSLRTRNPGTHAVLRSVLKTNEYARTLDLALAPLAPQ